MESQIKSWVDLSGGAIQFHKIKQYPGLLLTIKDGALVCADYSKKTCEYINPTQHQLELVYKELQLALTEAKKNKKELVGKTVYLCDTLSYLIEDDSESPFHIYATPIDGRKKERQTIKYIAACVNSGAYKIISK